MTFDDDVLRLQFSGGVRTVTCVAANIEWPPPERIEVLGVRMKLRRCSAIPDSVRANASHVARGAEYVPE